jgi:hypothetical protein
MKVSLALTAVLLSAACGDEPKKQLAPTAPLSKSISVQQSTASPSTVCLSYARDRAVVESELKDKPNSERLLKRHASLERLLRDACE